MTRAPDISRGGGNRRAGIIITGGMGGNRRVARWVWVISRAVSITDSRLGCFKGYKGVSEHYKALLILYLACDI